MRSSIRKRLTIVFIGLAVGPLLLVGIILAVLSYSNQADQALDLQQETAYRVATEVKAFFEKLEDELRIVGQAQGLQNLDRDKQQSVLYQLLSHNKVFKTLILLDRKGQKQVHLSLDDLILTDSVDFAEADEFVIPQITGQVYYSPIRTEKSTGEPLMTVAMPLFDIQSDSVDAVLVSEIRLKKIWDLIAAERIDTGQSIYIVDAQDRVVAHRDSSVVLRGTNFNIRGKDGFQSGLTGENVVLAVDTIRFGDQELNIVAEQTVSEALSLAINTVLITTGLIVAALVVAGSLVFLMVDQIIRPIQAMGATAQAISAGDLSQQVKVTGCDELGLLAGAFNSMTNQLRELIDSLEQRIANRTHRLETVATLGEQLNAILDVDELLREVVNQIKRNFGYYHAHIYLLDDLGEKLVVAAGTGIAGEQMIAIGHSISVNTPESLVARAARSGEVVVVDNVQQTKDWLPNPLLPDTRTEIAAPIIQKNGVIGVLDVQENKIGGLDEGDANLLRSLANQVAVALSNARLFEQTIQAKREAELAKTNIEIVNKALETQVWQTAGLTQLNERMQGEQDIKMLANSIIQQVCHYLEAQVGTLYLLENDGLVLVGGYAYTAPKTPQKLKLGETLVGQAALERKPIFITNVPDDCITINSSLGEIFPKNVMIFPFMYENRVVGVIELGALTEFLRSQQEFLQRALDNIAIAFTTAQARTWVNELLTETQQQAEELQSQEEELRAANEELESQAENLREQQATLDRQNQALKKVQQELEQKAEELALASKYKSEFLANMSHELRTPLNSLLILARMLARNEKGNLTPDQVESTQIIYSGGTDLLNLINDILDLSKIEAGKMEFRFAPLALEQLGANIRNQFNHVAENKRLAFEITLASDIPATIETDQQRLEQIIKNLLSNAFKFTVEGYVRLRIYRPPVDTGVDLNESGLAPAEAIAISVSDSGIGMTPEQQQVIFEPFRQADSSTNRQYGGTGLGLSISRELANRLGGQIDLISEKGKGSTFTLYLPLTRPEGDVTRVKRGRDKSRAKGTKQTQRNMGEARKQTKGAQRGTLPLIFQPLQEPPISQPIPPSRSFQPSDRILLIIEDDPKFAKVVCDYADKKKFKSLLAGGGKKGLDLAYTYPIDAVILDINLPDISGWEVLDALKNNPKTRHIPVHIISVVEENLAAYKRGAMGFLTKPVSLEDLEGSFQKIEQIIERKIKSLLLVEDDVNLRTSVRKLLEGNDVVISEAGLGQMALDMLAAQPFDCMILDLNLPDMSGFELLNWLDSDDNLSKCPVIIYTGKPLSEEENQELSKYTNSIILKGVKSPERLLDETALFLHRVIADLPEDKQQTIERLRGGETVLAGKNILIVDDDTRNAFALSKLLAEKLIRVYIAPNGQKALEILDKTLIDLVLMDIMMPSMDGYEVIRQIRKQQRFHVLPILALTAKAMPDDRKKCLEAGASDYLTKPVDPDRLFSTLRVWLTRGGE